MIFPRTEPLITKDTSADTVLRKYRRCILVFKRYGLTCHFCANAKYETIEQAARAKKIDLKMLLMELNIAAGLIPSNVALIKASQIQGEESYA